jgi:hypothetical protein
VRSRSLLRRWRRGIGRLRPPADVSQFDVGPRIEIVTHYDGESALPASLPDGTIAVVGSQATPKWAIFKCPCERGHVVRVNLSPSSWPYWRLSVDVDGLPSLRPSIDFMEANFRCHFLLIRGQVFWARGGDGRLRLTARSR